MERVGAHEAKTRLSEYLNRVRYGGERIVIERHGHPVAVLVGIEDLERLDGSFDRKCIGQRHRRDGCGGSERHLRQRDVRGPDLRHLQRA